MGKTLDEGRQVDVAFLDFFKAFDRVPHNVFLHKLCYLGISGNLLNWCKDYLSNRTQRVVIDGYSSSLSEITSGVPQGSILGPLFSVIFINDLPDVVCSNNTIALYADDSKMFRVIDCDEDLIYFQEDHDKLHQWITRLSLRVDHGGRAFNNVPLTDPLPRFPRHLDFPCSL